MTGANQILFVVILASQTLVAMGMWGQHYGLHGQGFGPGFGQGFGPGYGPGMAPGYGSRNGQGYGRGYNRDFDRGYNRRHVGLDGKEQYDMYDAAGQYRGQVQPATARGAPPPPPNNRY